MILCEQCGNEFYKGKKVFSVVGGDTKPFIRCPYCNYYNTPPWENKKRKKKGLDVRTQKE